MTVGAAPQKEQARDVVRRQPLLVVPGATSTRCRQTTTCACPAPWPARTVVVSTVRMCRNEKEAEMSSQMTTIEGSKAGGAMTDHRIGTRDEWLAAREQLLVREKEHTRLGDELAKQRRALPWVEVEKDYRFDTDDGEQALVDLFDGRSQLLVYHFMFGPSYDAGCPVNSSIADSVDGVLPHLHARDVTLLLVSQAPFEKLQAYRRRMGWGLPWASAAPTDFNFDLGFSHTAEQGRGVVAQMTGRGLPPIVEENARSSGTDVAGYLTERPGFSTVVREEGPVHHTYWTPWRGLEFVTGYSPILDRAPKGRDEGADWQLWIRRHDEYERERRG